MDFGCVRVFPPRFVRGSIELYRALMTDDLDRAVAAYEDWGFTGLSREMIAVLNRWAAFLYGPLMDDRPRRLTEGMAEGFGRDMAQNVFGELRRMGGVRPPREFVFMDRAAIGLGSVFIHLRASINWHTPVREPDRRLRRRRAGGPPAGSPGTSGPVMNILVTGSSGWLGQNSRPAAEARRPDGDRPRSRAGRQHRHRGLGRRPRPRAQGDARASHPGHRPWRRAAQAARRDARQPAQFIATNVQGTLNLLEEATAPGSTVDRFVFTSTTSLMISQEIREAHKRGIERAFWIDEEMVPLEPRNIYGVSKLVGRASLPHGARRHAACRSSSCAPRASSPRKTTWRTRSSSPSANTKANEYLFRRLTVEDAASAHIVALDRAPQIGFDTFIISALTPFSPEDCEQLMEYAPLVVRPLLPALSRDLRPPRLDDVRLHRPGLRFEQGDAPPRLRLPDRLRRHPHPARPRGRDLAQPPSAPERWLERRRGVVIACIGCSARRSAWGTLAVRQA